MGSVVTIITVVKNDIAGLKATAASVVSQNCDQFEWVIVDGYSSDGTWQYAERLSSLPFVKSVQSKPTGIYGAMNFGAKESNSPWIWFINAGDELLTDESVERISRIASEKVKTSIIATPVVYLTPTNHFFSLSMPSIQENSYGKYAIFHHQGCLMNRLIFNQVGGFDETFNFAADGKLLDSMISVAPALIAPIVAVGFEMGGTTSRNFWRSLNEIQLYRPRSFNWKKMIVFQTKEKIRGSLLKCLKTSIGRFVLGSYLNRREKTLVRNAESVGIYLSKRSASHG